MRPDFKKLVAKLSNKRSKQPIAGGKHVVDNFKQESWTKKSNPMLDTGLSYNQEGDRKLLNIAAAKKKVKKYNENHGEHGHFSSGGGGEGSKNLHEIASDHHAKLAAEHQRQMERHSRAIERLHGKLDLSGKTGMTPAAGRTIRQIGEHNAKYSEHRAAYEHHSDEARYQARRAVGYSKSNPNHGEGGRFSSGGKGSGRGNGPKSDARFIRMRGEHRGNLQSAVRVGHKEGIKEHSDKLRNIGHSESSIKQMMEDAVRPMPNNPLGQSMKAVQEKQDKDYKAKYMKRALAKYNANHGEGGRFSSGEGGGDHPKILGLHDRMQANAKSAQEMLHHSYQVGAALRSGDRRKADFHRGEIKRLQVEIKSRNASQRASYRGSNYVPMGHHIGH